MVSRNKIEKFFYQKNGIAKTSDIVAKGFHNRDIDVLINENKIIRLKRGVYLWIAEEEPEGVVVLNRIFPDSVICMDSALYYHGYTDRTPDRWHIAVDRDSNKSKFKINYPRIFVYFVKKKYLEMGVESVEISGISVKIYNKERTICDVIRYTNKLDKELVNKAIQAYIRDPERNITLLVDYAKKLRAYSKLQLWMGVWL